MSGTLPAHPPECLRDDAPSVALRIEARPRDLGGFSVRRVLPSPLRRRVGPFTFFDHMGPAEMAPGTGLDVRPHPHIALATVTYLFEGEIVHRDSVGSLQPIRPGDVNWMVAGRGIAHSERSSPETRRDGQRIHGIQSWVALPLEHEETEPSFLHHPRASIPSVTRDGALLDVIAGTAFGARSPVAVLSPTLYVHARLEQGARLPIDDEHAERAVYVVEGTIECEGQMHGEGTMLVLEPARLVSIQAVDSARLMLVGGAPLEGERHMWWNFVSSSTERLERAKADWKARRFPQVFDDADEFIPLPEG